MLRTTFLSAALGIALSGAAFAESHEVQMLNKGAEGTMVFEPSSLRIAVGDTVVFIPADKSHNAQSAKGMMPEGAEEFVGKMNQQVEATFDIEGFYGVICKPHFAMGMVMTIAVGDVDTAPDSFLEGRLPKKAKQRFEAQLSNL